MTWLKEFGIRVTRWFEKGDQKDLVIIWRDTKSMEII